MEEEFKPFIPAEKKVAEVTVTSIILGVLLAILFGGANAYLGLRVGMTVSASIPAAVVSMGVIRVILKRDSVLENNIVQTIGSAGESVAAGAIFTLPALFMWASQSGSAAPGYLELTCIALFGGILGVLFMVPLRKALIVQEHGVLPYPEGTACAEVILAGEKKGSKASTVFAGLGISALYKFLTDGLALFSGNLHYEFKKVKGAGIGIDVLPALVSVGYICGVKISAYMLSGGICAWLVIMPLLSLFGGNDILYPAQVSVNTLQSAQLWSQYIRYIGAGAVAAGGIISLIKSLPLIVKTFTKAMAGYGKSGSTKLRTERDISYKWIGLVVFIVAVLIWIVPVIPVNFVSALVIVIFGFFFATVSARMVGLVGSSNNPVSGMTIATLLIAAFILKFLGAEPMEGMVGAIVIGSIICIITAIAGDTSQDLKTGYILGATPKSQQLCEFIGVAVSALTISGVLYLLNQAWGFGSAELPAPQATLMKMVVEGVMGGNLPWTLVFAGVALAIAIEILGIPVLPFAVGLYLPINLSMAIMAGGLIRLLVEKTAKKKETVENGILYTSGMIAGEGLIGILLAVFAIIPWKDSTLYEAMRSVMGFSLGSVGAVIMFVLLLASIVWFSKRGEKDA